MKKLSLLLTCACILTLACLLSACTTAPSDKTETTVGVTEAPTQADQVAYTVTVVDQNGSPVVGTTVQMCTERSCLMPATTGEDGTVTFTLAPDSYHVAILGCPEGYTADAEQAFYFDEGSTTLTVTIVQN